MSASEAIDQSDHGYLRLPSEIGNESELFSHTRRRSGSRHAANFSANFLFFLKKYGRGFPRSTTASHVAKERGSQVKRSRLEIKENLLFNL